MPSVYDSRKTKKGTSIRTLVEDLYFCNLLLVTNAILIPISDSFLNLLYVEIDVTETKFVPYSTNKFCDRYRPTRTEILRDGAGEGSRRPFFTAEEDFRLLKGREESCERVVVVGAPQRLPPTTQDEFDGTDDSGPAGGKDPPCPPLTTKGGQSS